LPDLVDPRAPAVQQAPEERLESQQQMRRNRNVADSSSSGLLSAATAGGVRMSAQARPVSYIWEGDDEGGSGSGSGCGREVFQPENFMYLGPGAYADVSPLIEEEEEAARRTVAGDPGASRAASQAGSPEVSVKTTPAVTGSEVSPPAIQASAVPETEAAAAAAPKEREAVPAVEVAEEPVIHMLDSREMPHELPAEERYHPNPVGIIAEMATEHTAQAQVETNPPPVEIGDSSVLAPVEVALAKGIADEKKTAGQDVESIRETPAEKTSEEKEPARKQDDVPPKLTIVAKPPSAQYQLYKLGQAGPSEQTVSQPASNKRLSLQRDPSLMMEGASKDVVIDPGSVPAALAPRKHSHSISQSSITEDRPLDVGGETAETRRSLERDLVTVPPALQPSRTDGPSGLVGNTVDNAATAPEGQDASSTQPVGVSKFPSVLKPARGRAPTQPAAPRDSSPSGEATPFTPPPLKSYQLPPLDPVPSEVVNVAGPPVTQAPLTQAPVTQPFLIQQQQQPVRPATAFTAQRQSSAPGPEAMGIPQAVPPLGLPSHVAGISRPASTPAVVAPLKLSRQLSRKPLPETLREHLGAPNKFSQPPYTGPTSASEISQAMDRGAPVSAGSGTVSPLLSRSGRSDSASMQTPSPLDSATKGRALSTTSIHHSVSSDTVFTPSPVSTTPGSGGQPTRRPSSSLRNSISGPIPVQSPPIHGPPVPSKVPLEEESYFPPQDAVRTDKAAQSPGPARPPKEHHSKPQTPVSQQGPQGPDATTGYGLSRIDERHEDFNATRSPNAQVSPSTLPRRHSTASSIHPSRPPTVSSISSLENIRSFSPDDPRISTLSQTNEQMYGQGQMPPPGQFPPQQGQILPQGLVVPPGQQPPPGQQFPQGPHPQGHGLIPGPVPPKGVDQRQAGYPLQYQPVNHQALGGLGHHRQQTWHPQAQPHPQVQPHPQGQPQLQMMQGPGWNQPPGQGPPNFKDKDKEHKWTKWFKGPKGATLSKAPPGLTSPPITAHPPPPQPGLSNPGLGQMPTGGLQNKPPNVQHVRIPSGHVPQAGPPHNGMAQPQWQPPHGPPGPHPQGLQGQPRGPAGPQPPAHHHQGPPGPGPQQRISAPLQMSQGPPPPPAMHPAQAQVRAQVLTLNPNPNPTRSDRPAVNPGDALGSHPPSIPPLGAGPANAVKQAQRSSVIGPPAQWVPGGGQPAGSSAPNAPGPKPGPVTQGDKWARRPAGDYSGGSWG
jgi:hypothetical protein